MNPLFARRTFVSLGCATFLVATGFSTGCDKVSGDKPADSAPTAATPSVAPAVAAVPTEPITITPQALASEFKNNAAAAGAKYPRLTPFKMTGVANSNLKRNARE